MSFEESLIKNLCNVETEEGRTAWNTFFCEVDLVRRVTFVISAEQASKVLEEGSKWQGEGLNTSKASRRLYEACGVPLVTVDFRHCKEAFLFSLALTWGIEIQTL